MIEAVRSAVSRIAMTWSGALAKTSRWNRTPFCTYVTEVVAVVRSNCRLYWEALPEGKVSRRLPTVWYASCPTGLPSMFWLTRFCAWVHWFAKTSRRISASAPRPRELLGSCGPPAQTVSSLSCSRSASTLPNTMAPSRPLPIGNARSQSVPAALSYQSARSPAASTCGGAAEPARATAVQGSGSRAPPAPAAPILRVCRRVRSDIDPPSGDRSGHPKPEAPLIASRLRTARHLMCCANATATQRDRQWSIGLAAELSAYPLRTGSFSARRGDLPTSVSKLGCTGPARPTGANHRIRAHPNPDTSDVVDGNGRRQC